MKSKCSASVLAVRPHHRQHSLLIRILRGCHSQNTQIGGGVAWWHLPSCRSLMFDNVFLQDGSLSLSNSYRHEIPMCHTSYPGLFYQTIIHNLHQKHHFLHSLEYQGYHKRSNNKWFPFLWGFSWFGGPVLPRSTSHTIDVWRSSSLQSAGRNNSIHSQGFNKNDSPIRPIFQPLQTSKKIIQTRLTCFLFFSLQANPRGSRTINVKSKAVGGSSSHIWYHCRAVLAPLKW